MFTAILGFITSIFAPAAAAVDNLTTTEEEKLQLRNELANIQTAFYNKVLELEGKRMEMEAKVREAEAQSHYWITANWRPITSMILVATILVSAWMNKALPESVTQLAEVFLGVHAGGRTIEKIAKSIKLGK